jgi:hypothetical protein
VVGHLADVRSAVSEGLPGATLERGLFWRYLMATPVEVQACD